MPPPEGAEPIFLSLAMANPLLQKLSAPDLRSLLRAGTIVDRTSGEALLRQGSSSDAAYLLIEGEVDVLVETAYGSVHLARLDRGAVVGEIGVFTGVPRTASVVARDIVRALRFDGAHLISLGARNAAFLQAIMSRFGQQVSTFNHALGFYTNALTAIEQDTFDLQLLDDLMRPPAEFANFAETFRRMARQVVLRRDQRKEMANASAIQHAFLPEPLQATETAIPIDLHARMVSAKEIGGDLYDFFLLDPDRLAITIGDVCGKGVPAALFMAVTQSVLRLVMRQSGSLADNIRSANELIIPLNRESLFTTAFCGILDLRTGLLTYCNCGHNAPLLSRSGEEELARLERTGPPLGMIPNAPYVTRELVLIPDDCLVLFTDGITEAFDAADRVFGEPRLARSIGESRDCSASDIVERIFDAVRAFAGGAPQSDDMTCFALRYGRLGA
jgi:sigma-B regulation protein RsbU (phosphoserine phosphatase)